MTSATRRGFIVRQFPALGSRDYALLFMNSVFGSAAHWALLLARGWLVFDLTGSSTAVGVVTFAGMAPFLFASPIGGALADRMDRRQLSIISAYISLIGTLGLAAVTLGGIVEVWQVAAFALVGGIARAVQTPAAQAMTPNLVPPEHLLNGVALQSISQHGSRLAGPVFGTLLLTTVGAGWVFLLSGGLMLIGTIGLWLIRYRSAPDGYRISTGGLMRDMAEGMEYVGRDRRLALIIVLVVFHCALTMAFDSMMPRLASDVGGGERTFGAILMGIGAGAVTGTIFVSKLASDAAQGRTLGVLGVGSGLAMLVLGFATSPVGAVTGAVLAGGTQGGYMALSAAMVQAITPDSLRGRVMSIYIMLAAGHMAFVNLGFGVWADLIGVRALLVVPGLLWIAVLSGAMTISGDLRYLLRSGQFRERRTIVVAEAPAGGGGAA